MATSETTTAEVFPLLSKLKPRFLDGLTPSERKGILSKSRGKIVLRSPEALMLPVA